MDGAAVGRYISEAWPNGSLVALHTAGSTPYYGRNHRYIDMLGLNDAHIGRRTIKEIRLPWQRVPGHSKGDGAYVLKRNPDFIIAGPALGTQVERPWFLSDLELALNPEFSQRYERVQTLVPDLSSNGAQARVLTFYQRKQNN